MRNSTCMRVHNQPVGGVPARALQRALHALPLHVKQVVPAAKSLPPRPRRCLFQLLLLSHIIRLSPALLPAPCSQTSPQLAHSRPAGRSSCCAAEPASLVSRAPRSLPALLALFQPPNPVSTTGPCPQPCSRRAAPFHHSCLAASLGLYRINVSVPTCSHSPLHPSIVDTRYPSPQPVGSALQTRSMALPVEPCPPIVHPCRIAATVCATCWLPCP